MRPQKAAAKARVHNVLVTTIAQTDVAMSFLQNPSEWIKIYDYFNNNNNIEIEVRYRDVRLLTNTNEILNNLKIAQNRITVAAYQRLIDFYKKDNNFTYNQTIDVVKKFNNNIRSINDNYQQKVEFQDWPKHSNFGFTIAVSKETELTNVDVSNLKLIPNSQRQRNRQSFTFNINNLPAYRIDFTEVRLDIDLNSLFKDGKIDFDKLLPAVSIFDNYLLYYTLEIEYINSINNSDIWQNFRLAAARLLLKLQNTSLYYEVDDKYRILNSINYTLWSIFKDSNTYKDKDSITAKLLTQPRNLRMNEISWGQLFGHSDLTRTFRVTPKADGERRLLYITKDSIWLVAVPNQVSKVVALTSNSPQGLDDLLNRYDGAIFDGELVPSHNWRQPMGTPEFLPPTLENGQFAKLVNWFLLFDCIVSSKDKDGKNQVLAKLPLGTRLDNLKEFQKDWNQIGQSATSAEQQRLNTLASNVDVSGKTNVRQVTAVNATYKNNKLLLQINLKSYTTLAAASPIKHMGPYALYRTEHPANVFFISIRNELAKLGIDQQSSQAGNLSQFLPYVTDGLIFTPDGPYDPSPNNLSLSERKLDKVMDVLKWKPQSDFTVDLAVTIDKNNYKLEATASGKSGGGREGRGGNKIYKIVNYLINSNSITKLQNLPPRFVVEFAVNIVNDEVELDFKRLRPDKRYPNDIDIVNNNINLTNNPILADTLAGYNFKLMSTYHGRIKWLLFNSIPTGAVGLEIGAGQGGDLLKMARFSKVYSVEPNSKNILEYKNRLNNLIKTDASWKNRMVLLEQRAELPISKDIIPDQSVDFVSLMLCLTFFWDPSTISLLLVDLFNNINRVLKPGGRVIILTMDGDTVEEEFGLTGMDSFYPHPNQLTRTTVCKNLHRFGLGLESRDIDNNSSYSLPFNSQTPTELAIDSDVRDGDAYIKVLNNNQIHINIPGSIVQQNESLVYLQDISKIAPNFSLIKKGRADQELLLPYGHYQLSRMYSYAEYAKGSVDQRVQGSQSLTAPQLTQAIMNLEAAPAPAPGSFTSNILQPLPVIAPLVGTEAAQGDGIVEELPPNYIDRVEFQVVNNEVQQLDINKPLTFVDAFQGLRIARVATIFANPDNFFHAFLKATLAQYQNDRVYADRMQLANLARQAFAKFLLDDNYIQIASTEMEAPDPNTLQIVPFLSINNKPGLYTLNYLHNYANQLESNNPIAFDPGLASFVALLYKIHIIVIAITNQGKGILANTKADLPTQNYNRCIILLSYQKQDQSVPYHYEPIVVRNADGLNQSLFDSNSNVIQDLSDSFLLEETYNNNRAKLGL